MGGDGEAGGVGGVSIFPSNFFFLCGAGVHVTWEGRGKCRRAWVERCYWEHTGCPVLGSSQLHMDD